LKPHREWSILLEATPKYAATAYFFAEFIDSQNIWAYDLFQFRVSSTLSEVMVYTGGTDLTAWY
jgi:hypothetical protein